MKKIVFLVLFLIGFLWMMPVHAANYELKELIPLNIKTTIVTDNFSYRNFYYSYSDEDPTHNHFIYFGSIKNISDSEKPVSISIGLFDKNKLNMGIVHYCASKDNTYVKETILKSKEEKSFVIEVKDIYIPDDMSLDDVHYFAILGDNISCRTDGSQEFVGKLVEDVGMIEDTKTDVKVNNFLYVLLFLGAFLVVLFLYKFMFTTAYSNMDGEDTRREFKSMNKQLKEEREYEEKHNPKPEPEKKQEKSDEVIRQEEMEAKKKEENSTDLHNFYK